MTFAAYLGTDTVTKLDRLHSFNTVTRYHRVPLNELFDELGGLDIRKGLQMSEARRALASQGPNIVQSPQRCPSCLCCLLPCLNTTYSMRSYFQCRPDAADAVREGTTLRIEAEALVMGDIISVSVGDVVPADARVLSCSVDFALQFFQHDMLVLNGFNSEHSLPNEHPLLAKCLVWMGCRVHAGSARCLVVQTGSRTLMSRMVALHLWPPLGEDSASSSLLGRAAAV